MDFLIPLADPGAKGGILFHIEDDFAAITSHGLRCAFRDRVRITLSGTTIYGEQATRAVWVSDAGAFVVLKALAFRNRGENKDAYDLYYVIRNYGDDVGDVAAKLLPLLDDPAAQTAIEILRSDFTTLDSLGAMRVANFLFAAPDDAVQAEVSAFVNELLGQLARLRRK